jgi:uncharacterized protein (TIGR03435 family)
MIHRVRTGRHLWVVVAALLMSALSAAAGQSASAEAAAPGLTPLHFDVVSVRPNHSDDQKMSLSAPRDGDTVSYINYPLYSMVIFSNDFHSSNLVSGLPEWTKHERYDVIAKVAPEDVERYHALSSKQRFAKFQAVLADRFKLRFHLEPRELPVLNMEVAKGAPKLKEADPNNPLGLKAKYGQTMLRIAPGEIQAEGANMSDLAMFLTAISQGRQIIDKTGLTGKYDFTLRYTADMDSGTSAPESGVPPPTADAPLLETALREQLGLQLKPGKAVLECFVVDHIERPSEN